MHTSDIIKTERKERTDENPKNIQTKRKNLRSTGKTQRTMARKERNRNRRTSNTRTTLEGRKMLKITTYRTEDTNKIWTLEDGTELWDTKWNGEVYEQDGKEYKPVYEEDPDFEDQFDLIGFEEV